MTKLTSTKIKFSLIIGLVVTLSTQPLATAVIPQVVLVDSFTEQIEKSKNDLNVDLIKVNQADEPFFFKVMSLNLLQTGVFDTWRDAIVEENADIVLLQETGGFKSAEDEAFLAAYDYINTNMEVHSQTPYPYYNLTEEPNTNTGGAIIFSKYPIVELIQIKELPLDNGTIRNLHHDWLHAIVDVVGTEIHFFANHFACCGLETSIQFNQWDMEATMNYVDTLGDVPIILGGDINSVSVNDVGLWPALDFNLGFEPINMLIDPTHPKASTVHEWKDVFRELNPTDPGGTYLDDQFYSRIDYLFVNEFFFDKLVNSTVADTPSSFYGISADHATIDAVFNLNPAVDVRPPERVTNVEVVLGGTTDARITWNAVADSDVASYNLYRDDIFIKAFTSSDLLDFTDTGLTDGQTYKYEIEALDVNENIGFKSYPVRFDLAYGQYRLPEAPVVTGTAGEGSNTISWTLDDSGGYDIVEYKVYRAIDTSIERDEFLLKQRTSSTTWTDTALVNGREYYYRIAAVNELGNIMASLLVEGKYIDRYGEGPVSNVLKLVPTGGQSSNGDDSNFIVDLGILGLIAVPLIRRKIHKV